MADKEHFTESIKYSTELLRLTRFTLVAVVGGSISLLLGQPTTSRLVFAGTGVIVTLICLLIGWRLDRNIRALIIQLKELP